MGRSKKSYRTILVVVAMLVLNGCWDIKFLDRLGVVIAMGFDEDPTGKHALQVSVQVVLTQNVTPDTKVAASGPPFTTLTETGDTVFEVIRKLSDRTSRRLFFSHTQIVVVGEGLAKKQFYPLFDFIERNPEMRGDISVAIVQGSSAKDLLSITTQMESFSAKQIFQIININESAYGNNNQTTVHDIVRVAGMGGEQVAVPVVKIIGDKENLDNEKNISPIKPQAYPVVQSMAIFKKGKLVGYLTTEQSRGYSWLKDKMKSTVIKLKCPNDKSEDRKLVVEVLKTNTKTTTKMTNEGKPKFDVEINTYIGIREVMCLNLSIIDEDVLQQVSQLAKEFITAELDLTLHRIKKNLKSDVLGWGRKVYREYPKQWKKIAEDWNDIFPNVDYNIICNITIKGAGVRNNVIRE